LKKKGIIALICSVLLLHSITFAASWNEILKYAESHNEDILSAKKTAEIYDWQYKNALTNFLPQISLSAGITKSYTNNLETTSSQYGLSLSQTLFSGFGNINQAKKAFLQINYYKSLYNQQKSDALYQVRNAYISLLISQKELSLLQKIYGRREENTKLVKLLYENGKEDIGNYLQTQADLENARVQIDEAKRNLDLAKTNLSNLIGVKIEKIDDEPLLESITENKKIDFDKLLENSPKYLAANYIYEMSKIDVSQAASQFLPMVGLNASLKKTGSSWPPQIDSPSWSITMSYSIFDGGSNIINLIEKNLSVEKAKTDLEKTRKELMYNLIYAYNNLLNKLDELKVREKYLTAASERAKIARMKYMNGLLSYYEWDNVENTYITAEKEMLTGQKNSLLSQAQWENSYGGWVK